MMITYSCYNKYKHKKVVMDRNKTVIEVIDGGPLKISGSICIVEKQGGKPEDKREVYLCRCGKSASKPYCDGSHNS